MSDERLLFDRKLLRARRARFAPEIEAHEFLLAHVAREIAERVELMLRPFPLALDLGAYHGLLGRKVAELPVGRRDDLCRERVRICRAVPAPVARLRRGFAAVQGAELQSDRLRVGAAPGQRSSRRAHPDQARAAPRRLVHGGAARRPRFVGAASSADRGRGRDRRRRKPARRPVRRCARVWRVAATRGLRAPGCRCRDLDGALCQPTRTDARGARAGRRQRAAGAKPGAALAQDARSAPKRSIASAMRRPTGG